MAANALFRGIIGPNDFLLAIAEGDLRTEWAESVREVARQILTAGEYSEAELRGYIDATTRRKKTAQHGMSTADSDLLHLIQGRPLAVHQVTTGLARGGKYGGLYTDVPEPYQDAIRESNIKEPWAGLAYANRYTYPSGFQIKAETKAHTLTQPQAYELLLEVGWSPHWADFFTKAWAGTAATSADPHVTKASNQLWATLHRSYMNGETDDATATQTLATLGVDTTMIPEVLSLWTTEKALTRRTLTAAQVKKAYSGAVINPDTGAAWTKDEALAALVALGYSMADATTFLEL
jgi:SOS response regulatory protein OraA/RecX